MKRSSESGNIFFALFGAVALVGILGAGVMTFMKGPLATSVKITRINTAETQMNIGAQVAVMAAANGASNGDCDSDTYVEPMEWRTPTTEPVPTNGGLIPLTLGISKKDPWGTEYGYCVWNHGPITSGSGCGANMLAGTNSTIYPVVAIVSAGQDKTFTTTCRDFATADGNADGDLEDAGDLPLVSKAAETDDDIIFTYTYEEATGASGGLWSIKSGEPDTAVINKKIETTGTASFAGGVLLPDSSLITCDPTTAGVMARNASGNGIEICDGSGWTAISGGSVGGSGLILTPNVSSAMDVDGTCGNATCYSSNVVFTLTNNLTPAAASDVLSVSLSNLINFEKVSDNCNGNSIAAGATCQIVVRAKASGNVSYAATLSIIGNNSPLATLDGTASNFPGCNAGGNGPGGYYVACGIGGYDLVVTPSGCTGGMTNPTCDGSIDTLLLYATSSGAQTAVAGCCTNDGATNTKNLMAYTGGSYSFPAASWCDGLVYQGYDDWFLPSINEMTSYFYPNPSVGYDTSVLTRYWSSTETVYATNNSTSALNTTNGASLGIAGSTAQYHVRCMRWTPAKVVVATPDTEPLSSLFKPATVTTAAQTVTSNSVTIYGVTSPVSISVSGGTNAKFSKNGGAYTTVATTATNGDTITLQASSPALGIEQIVTLTAGSSNFTWKVRTAGSNTIRAFTTSDALAGNIGGLGGADSKCTIDANTAGLGGNWVAVMAGSGDNMYDRLPWDWQTLKNMNNQVVATSINDFMDGSISAPMNYTQTGAVPAASQIWTGLDSTGTAYTNSASNCTNWASNTTGVYGDSASTGSGLYFSVAAGGSCSATKRLLCMEKIGIAGEDGDPDPVYVAPAVSYVSGGAAVSNTVTVTGIIGTIMVTISPSAGSADIIKNGVPVGATTTLVSNNDTIAFSLTTPATAGQKNSATLTFGPDSYAWWAGYADNSNIGMVFVAGTLYQGQNLAGLAGADIKCQSAATAAGLSGTWTAILSSSTINAIDRIPFNFGEIRRADQSVLASNWGALWAGSLTAPPILDENGKTVVTTTSSVWSGSDSLGVKYASAAASFCNDWQGPASTSVRVGKSNASNYTWINGGVDYCNYDRGLYCMAALTPAQNDRPAPVEITPVVVTSSGGRGISASVTIQGISTSVTASISASGGDPKLKVNGGAEVASASVSNGDTVEFLLDAPTSAGTKRTATISIGASTYNWWVGYANPANTAKIFVSSTSYNGALGGLSGADTKCNTVASAAGLGTGWTAILSSTTTDAVDRAPFDWGVLKRIDNTVIANSWSELWSGSIATWLNISETGAVRNTYVSTGTNGFGRLKKNYNCLDWTDNLSTTYVYKGSSTDNSAKWMEFSTDVCANAKAIYCMKVE